MKSADESFWCQQLKPPAQGNKTKKDVTYKSEGSFRFKSVLTYLFLQNNKDKLTNYVLP